jgi:sialate O-acetylesterase
VTFANVEGMLLAYSAAEPIGFELCGAAQTSCRFVRATMQPAAVVLVPGEIAAPTRVRFCWGDGPICNLYDRSGLPAGPFELQIQ